ncbi:hypothetical protein FM120_11085 [Sphingobacterium faecium PCAi_F2.5]|nr:hypothetical protein FM120_11085 [Sphingobacterium faecium PCAi_F2.5]
MNRENKKTTTKEVSTAGTNGWNLNFSVESSDDKLKTIQVSGTKGQNYFSANRQENGQISNSFTGTFDVDLLSDVVAEFESITSSFTVESE